MAIYWLMSDTTSGMTHSLSAGLTIFPMKRIELFGSTIKSMNGRSNLYTFIGLGKEDPNKIVVTAAAVVPSSSTSKAALCTTWNEIPNSIYKKTAVKSNKEGHIMSYRIKTLTLNSLLQFLTSETKICSADSLLKLASPENISVIPIPCKILLRAYDVLSESLGT